MSTAARRYSGRFAPSPTGPLHAGSLIAALASYLDARAAGGQWLLRIDDIDPPRAMAGATERIVACLHAHGLIHDAAIRYQSERNQAYDAALATLAEHGHTFHCSCTRRSLGPTGDCVADCATRETPTEPQTSVRIRVPKDWHDRFDDALLGTQHTALGASCSNFILKRRDGLYAYQLACAVDDGAPDISHVIRGADLLSSTHRQRWVQTCLGLTPPVYGHLPVVTDPAGNKLSKQTGAPPLDNDAAAANLRRALSFLGQPEPPPDADVAQILSTAVMHWSPAAIPR